jgi:ferredoxin--NADP+ reductase
MAHEESERIPLTLSDWNSEKGTITVFYQVAGFSTKELARVGKDKSLYSVVGPLGNPIEIANYGTVLLGGGCYGIGGIYPVAKSLKEAGNTVMVLLEAKNELLLYLEEVFKNIADEMYYCTSDGSKGIKGKIKEGLSHIFEEKKQINRCYFIGCKYMMKDAVEFTEDHGRIPTYVSLNTIMIDGTGMCGGCRLSLEKEGDMITKFACVDGPTFDGHLVKWDELIKRKEQFSLSEKEVYQEDFCRALKSLKEDNYE